MRDVRFWRRRQTEDDDLDREIQTHLDLAAEEHRGAGLPLRDAQLAAHREFGSVALTKEELRDMRTGAALERLWQETRFAGRRLLRSPVFTVATVLTLALAIGANVAIFAVVYRVLLNPLPFGDPSRLIALDYGVPGRNVPSGWGAMTWQLYFHLLENAHSLDGVAAYNTASVTMTGRGTPERIQVARATPSLAGVLRVAPQFGRWFTESEGVPGASQVAVLSHGLWTRRFGRDRSVIGQAITIEGVPAEIVGVMPAAFAFPSPNVDAWMPTQSTRATASFLFDITGIARLRDGVTIPSARAEITGLIANLARVAPNQTGLVSTAVPLQESIVGRVANTLWFLFGAVGLLLLVACSNVANLFLVRSEARQRELAVRRALGAGRAAVAHCFLAESTLLSLAGCAVGLGIAWSGVRLLAALGPANLPRFDQLGLDPIAIGFALTLSSITAVTLGAIAMIRMAPLTMSLRETGRGQSASRGRLRARHVLMAVQVAFALVLLVGSGLMVRSFQALRAVNPGFAPASALTFSVGLPAAEYSTRRSAASAHQAILDRLANIPDVKAASASTVLPLSGGGWGNSVQLEGGSVDVLKRPPIAMFRAVAGRYFETMGIPIVRGRGINREDVDRNEPIVVINQALANILLPGGDLIQRRVRTASNAWLTIVGIVANTPTNALAEGRPMPLVYMPMSIAGGPDIPAQALVGPSISVMSYVVRSASLPFDLLASARAATGDVDRNLALAQAATLQDLLDRAAAQMAFTMVLMAIAASVSLLLGIIGIYGAMSYIVSQRTGEIGVRLALGAEPGNVARMIVWQGAVVALAGITVGLASAFAGGRVIQSLLYGISPRDPSVFTGMTLLLLGVALLACWLPARRAARLSPLDALRAE